MNKSLALALLGATFAASALPALAQPAPAPPGPRGIEARLFQQADANQDRRVTEDEAMAFLAARFAEADTSRDGALTPEELQTYLRAQWQAMRPGPAAGNDPRPVPPPVQRAMTERQDRFFRMADANRDGRLTMDEMRPLAAMYFRAADRNGDGALEMTELRGPERRGPRGADRTSAPGGSETPAR